MIWVAITTPGRVHWTLRGSGHITLALFLPFVVLLEAFAGFWSGLIITSGWEGCDFLAFVSFAVLATRRRALSAKRNLSTACPAGGTYCSASG